MPDVLSILLVAPDIRGAEPGDYDGHGADYFYKSLTPAEVLGDIVVHNNQSPFITRILQYYLTYRCLQSPIVAATCVRL